MQLGINLIFDNSIDVLSLLEQRLLGRYARWYDFIYGKRIFSRH